MAESVCWSFSVQHFSIIGKHVINKYNMNEWIDFANRKVHRDGRAKAIVAPAPAATPLAAAASDFSSSFIVLSEIPKRKRE